MPTGQRGSAPVSPMNRTGQLFQQQLRDRQAKDAAKDVDVNEVKRQAYKDGYTTGFEEGFGNGWTALGELLIESGVITEERLLELVNSTDEPAAEAE